MSIEDPQHNICESDKVYDDTLLNMFNRKVFAMGVMNIMSMYNVYCYGDVALSWWETMLFVVITLAWALRMWAYYELGRLFTYVLCIRKEHELITTGPYKYLAHPSYTGHFLINMGISLLLAYPLAIVLLLRFNKLLDRIHREEQMLILHFGPQYEEFISTRWRLIPYIY